MKKDENLIEIYKTWLMLGKWKPEELAYLLKGKDPTILAGINSEIKDKEVSELLWKIKTWSKGTIHFCISGCAASPFFCIDIALNMGVDIPKELLDLTINKLKKHQQHDISEYPELEQIIKIESLSACNSSASTAKESNKERNARWQNSLNNLAQNLTTFDKTALVEEIYEQERKNNPLCNIKETTIARNVKLPKTSRTKFKKTHY